MQIIRELVHVDCDDWQGLYFCGLLIHEGLTIPKHIWLRVVKMGVTKTTERYCCAQWLEREGKLPQLIGNVVFEDF